MAKRFMWEDWALDDLIGMRYDIDECISMSNYNGNTLQMERDYDEWNAINARIRELENAK